jgi:hypothetical protein
MHYIVSSLLLASAAWGAEAIYIGPPNTAKDRFHDA